VLLELHKKLDVAVAEAYGWPPDVADAADLANDELLMRLVALHAERAEEERAGLVHWLRPEYQLNVPAAHLSADPVDVVVGRELRIAAPGVEGGAGDERDELHGPLFGLLEEPQ